MFYINCLFYCFPDSCTFLFSIHYLLVWAFLLSVLDTKMGQRALVLSLKYCIANFYYIVIFSQQQIQIVDITVHLLLELRVILASQPQFLYFLNILLIYLCFGCAGFSLLHTGFLQLQVGATPLFGCSGFCLWWFLLLWSTGWQLHGLHKLQPEDSEVAACGLQSTGSVVVAHESSCSTACGIFLDQGSKPRSLHWQADSYPLPPGKSFSFHIFNMRIMIPILKSL